MTSKTDILLVKLTRLQRNNYKNKRSKRDELLTAEIEEEALIKTSQMTALIMD